MPPGGLGFGTGGEPRTVEAMPDSLNICEPCCSIEIPGGLGHRRFVDVDGVTGGDVCSVVFGIGVVREAMLSQRKYFQVLSIAFVFSLCARRRCASHAADIGGMCFYAV